MCWRRAWGRSRVLVGSFGQEKPTLLRLTAGVDRPDGGRILPGDGLLCGPSGLVEPEGRPEPVEGVVIGITLMGEIAQLCVSVAASGETLRLRSRAPFLLPRPATGHRPGDRRSPGHPLAQQVHEGTVAG